MIPQYKTVQQENAAEIVIKRSRFIGHAKPVYTEEEAVQFIQKIKKQHAMATHNCSAYMIGERNQIQKQSDDGEPSGTAGKPILEVIRNQKMQNIVIVITRYFGGILLGAGGLVRAYTDGAVAAIEAARPIYRILHQEIRIDLDYTRLGKVQNELRNKGTMLGQSLFTDKVSLFCYPLAEEAEFFMAWMTDLTQGQSVITAGDVMYKDHETLP
ncbi:YigZ family protein [Paenibacillus larvae subsp. pulvifaciens]|uniref:YigZ family protein n=1 Tax=Paenibacillus larvae subsp. pulvifaciens TaxID=1477 RepID=A0A1V0UU48_9BACL|nr:YigZ family protein [Paenibacillus larvae]ARF68775.1 YigZ family protein [Paenibacillus larvae subsp. pulvifaciens]